MGTIEDVANEQIEVANNTDQIPAGYKSPLLSRSGAAEAQGAAAQAGTEGVAWHYGSPLVEQLWSVLPSRDRDPLPDPLGVSGPILGIRMAHGLFKMY